VSVSSFTLLSNHEQETLKKPPHSPPQNQTFLINPSHNQNPTTQPQKTTLTTTNTTQNPVFLSFFDPTCYGKLRVQRVSP